MELHVNGTHPARTSAASATASRPGTPAYCDPIPRRRDRFGNRKPSGFAYHDPYPGNRPVNETWLGEVLAEIETERPAHAGYLRHYHDHRLLPAMERFRAVQDRAEADRAEWNAHARRQNLALDAEQRQLYSAAAAAARPHREQALSLDAMLAEAHFWAAERVATIGRTYDPTDPSAADVVQVEEPDLGTFAAQLHLPDPRADREVLLPGWLGWLLTGLVGVLLGLSVGLQSGFFSPDELGPKAGAVVVVAVLGLAPAIFGRKAILMGHRQAAERAYLGRSWRDRLGVLLGAFAVDAVVLAADVAVERAGLLRSARLDVGLQTLDGSSPAVAGGVDLSGYLAPLLITFGYVAYSAWEGYLLGRRSVVTNQLLQAREASLAPVRQAHRARPEVQTALAAVHYVKALVREQREHEERASDAARPFEERATALEQRRLGTRESYTPEQLLKIQDEHDNLLGADWEFSRLLRPELALLEPRPARLSMPAPSRRSLQHHRHTA